MIQSLGLGRDVQETKAERVIEPGGRVAERLDEAVWPEPIAPEAVVEPLTRKTLGLESDTQETEVEPAEESGSKVAERSVEAVALEHTASGKAAVEPLFRKNGLGLGRDLRETETVPVEQPVKVAESFEGAVGLEHIALEYVAIEPLSRIVYHTDPSGLGADRFRYLRLRLRELSNTGKLKSLLVTSPLPLDGKSTIALNLATVLADGGDNAVLLVEADLYNPVLVGRLGLDARPGLSECLTSGLDPIPMLRRVSPLGFYLLSGGKPLANPGDLLHGEAFVRVMQVLSPHFKWIVIDSPPVVPLADALALARQADASLLVVRAGRTPSEAVDTAIQALGAKHVLGVVLNGVEGLARRYSKYRKYYKFSAPGDDHTGKGTR